MTFDTKMALARIERFQLALRRQDCTAQELADAVFLHPRYAVQYIRYLHDQGRIHICEYRLVRMIFKLCAHPVYAWGPGADAPPPKRLTHAERSRIRRKDPEFRLREAAKQRAKRIMPYRDWTAAWIPTRGQA